MREHKDRFDFERAVERWRKNMSQRRTFSSEDLDELESHLRDRVDALVASGCTPSKALSVAIEEIGEAESVETEYRKTRWAKARHRREVLVESAQELALFSSYIRIAIRNFRRHRVYALINLGGLTAGITAFLLIALFVAYETSYDRHFERADKIYRVTREWFDGDGRSVMQLARISQPIAPALETEMPEVERAVRLMNVSTPVRNGDERFLERNVFYADSSFFEVFSDDAVAGDLNTALDRPNSVVITDEVARRYFGDQPAVGKRLTFFDDVEMEVTAVVRPFPSNSHFHPDLVASFSTTRDWFDQTERSSWGMYNNFATYLLMREGSDVDQLRAKLPSFLRAHYEPENNSRDELKLQALTDIHLRSHLDSELEANGNSTYVLLFAGVAIFVLLIACFNFVNLATARSMDREHEVGVRKVLGALPAQVLKQFLGEAMVLSFTSTLLSVGLVVLALPYFRHFTGRDLSLAVASPWQVGLLLTSLVAVVGLVAGSYPALVMSRFRPSTVLGGEIRRGWKSRLRAGLVVSQFAIATILICGMGVVLEQVYYVQHKQLGFDKEHLVVLPAGDNIRNQFDAVRERLLQSPQVVAVTASRLIPSGSLVDHIGVEAVVGGEVREGTMPLDPVDHDFVKTYGMEVVAGRDFEKDLASDSTAAYILNESAVNLMGWSSPQDAVGSRFTLKGNSLTRVGTVVGVVRDFHFESLRERISPLVMFIMPERYRNVTVRLAGGDPDGALKFLAQRWAEYQPDRPFTYSFVDQNFGALYDAERRLGAVFGVFAGLAVVIACLGLLGLASFVTRRRTKEVGIRKSLGASPLSLILTLSRSLMGQVSIAFVLAVPVSIVLMRWWLDHFAYHTGFDPLVFVLAGFGVVGIAFLTVGVESFRAAVANPIHSLRDE